MRQPVAPSPLASSSREERKFGIEDGEKELGKICFSCICSFKKDEKETFQGHQEVSAQERWKGVLRKEDGGSWDTAPGVDTPWYVFCSLAFLIVSLGTDTLGKSPCVLW